ncbi:KPN_02809 family neutral zinc metallopeptidase [Knoellia subterranea]|uniref:Membrane protein n=1 Tax=Knoellia subterranea KCTC 19937 TaxID=1385521 RepID=A0A0A0JRQ6_9MICO|nr:neutral zinc metallopeptidase [Knoellia subterranea]KGN38742.1 membrane protein [Knoellia subterranea KCTC 19937]
MSFNDDVRLDTSQVESGGGGGGAPGGIVVGGGIGGIILLILSLIFGIPMGTDQQTAPPSSQEQVDGTSGNAFENCKTGADANADVQCRVIGTVNSVQAFWTAELPRYQKQWQPTKTVLYSGATQSQCGTASNQVGPFYCPLDQKVYIDADFFAILTQQFGSDDGALAQEYVVAHEYGHALQDQLGLLGRAQQDPQGANSGAVRIELMADCLAGVWAQHASTANGPDGKPYLKQLTEADIKSALSAAAAVGDDRIQEKTQGQVNPEAWTHGSAEARQRWFLQGYKTGDLNQCNTFNVDQVS